MRKIFVYVLFILLSFAEFQSEEQVKQAKMVVCLVLSRSLVQMGVIDSKDQQSILNGIVNCYVTINEEQLIKLSNIIHTGQGTELSNDFLTLVDGSNIESKVSKEKLQEISTEINQFLVAMQKMQEENGGVYGKKSGSSAIMKLIPFLMDLFVNGGYFTFALILVLLFFSLRSLRQLFGDPNKKRKVKREKEEEKENEEEKEEEKEEEEKKEEEKENIETKGEEKEKKE